MEETLTQFGKEGLQSFLAIIPFSYLFIIIVTSLIFFPLKTRWKSKLDERLMTLFISIFWAGVTYVLMPIKMQYKESIASMLVGAAVAIMLVHIRCYILNKKK